MKDASLLVVKMLHKTIYNKETNWNYWQLLTFVSFLGFLDSSVLLTS